MKKAFRLLLTCASLALAAQAHADQTITYPAESPIFSISFPDDWAVTAQEETVSITTPDHLVNMELMALESDALDGAMQAAKEMLAQELKGVEFTGEPEKTELNGMDVTFLNGKATLEGVEMAVNCALFAPKEASTFFMLFNIIPTTALEQHGEDISKVLGSIISIDVEADEQAEKESSEGKEGAEGNANAEAKDSAEAKKE